MGKTVLGLIGGGNSGRIHINNIVKFIPEAELKYVADPYPEKYNKWAEGNGCPKAIEDYKVIMKDPEVDAVVICSPVATHADLIVEAARAGKHIFCEKPIEYSIEKTKEAMKVVEECNVQLQIGYNRRFDHNHGKAKKMIEEGKVGEVHIVKITSRDPVPPPPEYFAAIGGANGGIFLDTSIHDIDMARFLCSDSEVEEIFATGSALINKDQKTVGGVDTCIITLRFKNGSMAIIDNSWKAVYGYDQRLEVFGSEGTINIENDTPSTAVLSNEEGIIGEKPLYFYVNRYVKSFQTEMEEFLKSIVEDKDTPTNAIDGYYGVLIAIACNISLAEKRIVTMDEMLKK